MNITIKTKQLDRTPVLEADVFEKVQSIEKFLAPTGDQEILAEVELGIGSAHHHENKTYRAEINLRYDGTHYRAEASAETVIAALDMVRDEMVRVITHAADKKADILRRGGRMIKRLFTGK